MRPNPNQDRQFSTSAAPGGRPLPCGDRLRDAGEEPDYGPVSWRRSPELSGAPDRAQTPETPLRRTRDFPRGRRRALLVPLLLAGAALLGAVDAAAQETLWEATMTVGLRDTGGGWYVGYEHPRSGATTGSISTDRFTVDGAVVVPSSLKYLTAPSDTDGSGASVKLLFEGALSGARFPTDKADWVLTVGSDSFWLGDCGSGNFLSCNITTLDWEEDDEIVVKLTQAQAPPAPRLTAQGGARRIDLSWDAKTGGSEITGYKIEVSVDGTDGSWTELVESTTETTYSHTGLSATARRYYRVTATNAIGTGPASSVVWATPVAQPVDTSGGEGVFGKVLWSATMTTAAFTNGGVDFVGFNGLASEGSLDPDEFVIPAGIEYGGSTFGFDVLAWRDGDDTVRPNTLWMELKIDGTPCGVGHHPGEVFPDWALHVGGKKLWFADLESGASFCLAQYIWHDVHLPWTGGETVEVKITSGETAAYPELLPVQDATVAESGDTNNRETTMTFTVAVDLEPDFPVGVHYKTEDVDATGGASCNDSPIPDYISTEGRLTFGPGVTSHEVEVTVCDDGVEDTGETFRLVLNSTQLHESIEDLAVRGTIREYGEDEETGSATGTITNDESTTEVSIAADSAYVEEGTEAAFTLRRTGDAEEALTVPVSVIEDGAALGTPVPESVTFEAGSPQAALRVPTDDDGADEADSTVTATLQTGTAWLVAEGAASAALTVLDNDAASVTATSAADVTVWSADMTVVDYENGNIGAGSADLLANQGGSAGLRAKWLYYVTGERKLKIAFDDGLDDAESLTLHVGAVSVAFPENSGGDSSFSITNVDVSWADGETLAARVSKPSAAAVSTDATLASLAVAGAELSPAFDAGTLLYAAAVDSATASVTVAASANDGDAGVAFVPSEDADAEQAGHQVAVPEGETLVTVTVTAADGNTAQAYRVVVNRPPTVAVSFGAASYTATEGGDAASVVVALDADPKRDVTIPLTATPAGGAAAEDYTLAASVSFTSGGALSQTVAVTAVSDDAEEDGESVALGFGTLPDGVEAGATTSAAVTLADAVPEAVNTAPTGLPAITGTAQVGETLTASVDEIEDEDGLDDATFTYQWVSNDGTADSDIEDATDSTYELVAADAGKTIKVRVTFTDDGGTDETLVSEATEAVATAAAVNTAPTGLPAIAGTPTVGETLTASADEIEDEDGLDDATFAYQWVSNDTASDSDIEDATDSTYELVAADAGKTIKVRVTFTDDGGTEETLVSAATEAVASRSGATVETTTSSPTIGIAGGSGTEGDDDAIEFTVTLDEAASGTVTVDYATSDGTANAGDDYTAKSGTLSFSAGQTSKTISVGIEDDIENESDETFTVTLSNASGADLGTSAATGTIRNRRVTPLTASFEGVPAEHDGESVFTFRLRFSEDPAVSYTVLRDEAFSVTGGAVQAARRVDGRNDLREIHVEPEGQSEIRIALPATTDCDAANAICTADGRPLSHSLSATVAGPVGISVADARVEEGEGAQLAFVVTLTRAASGALTVDYATSDGTAEAGADYTAASGTLSFGAGESSKTIRVAVLDDSHDDGGETLTLTLSNPSKGRLTDATATGTIENRDPLPRALLARFGRTAAVHVVEQVEERLTARRDPGFEGRFAGRELRPGMEREIGLGLLNQLAGRAGGSPFGQASGAGTSGSLFGQSGFRYAEARPPEPGAGMGAGLGMGAGAGMDAGNGGAGPNGGELLGMGLGGENVLNRSGFALNRAKAGGVLSLWSRGAQSRFSGREGTLSLGGDVRTTMFGADYAKGPLVTGLSLSHSRGLGEYTGATGGRTVSSVTGLYPWLGYRATDRITVWGVGGYGSGGLLLTPDGGSALESDLTMKMAAAGTRGELVAGGAGGFGLAFKADALWVGTSVAGADGPGGRLKATGAAVSRFRTGLEGSRNVTLAGRMSLQPSVEVGLRRDGGDAETGAGVDIGGGLVLADPATGLLVDVKGRMLVAHQDEGFRERGISVSLSYDPTPRTPLGLTARVAPSWGGSATSGAEALWGRETMAGLAPGRLAAVAGNRFAAQVGYGMPVGSRFVGTPRLGVTTSVQGRDYRLGYGLAVLEQGNLRFELGIDAQRRENPLQGVATSGVLGRATVSW